MLDETNQQEQIPKRKPTMGERVEEKLELVGKKFEFHVLFHPCQREREIGTFLSVDTWGVWIKNEDNLLMFLPKSIIEVIKQVRMPGP